jgi:endonuclease YncB( thermonuclease family)
MASAYSLLKHALILDTETLGLKRGVPIHEIAIYSFDKQEAYEYLLKPRMVEVAGSTAQDFTRLASSVNDEHFARGFPNWREAIKQVAAMHTGQDVSKMQTEEAVRAALRQTNEFLYNNLFGENAQYAHLWTGEVNPAQQALRFQALEKLGIKATSKAQQNIEDLLKPGGLLKANVGTQGTTLWIANAGFEGKQLGAQLGAMGPEAVRAFKSQLETSAATADPLYVTGVEVNQARAKAQMTGDWTDVWKAYNKYGPKSGEIAVRDIQDVTRAMVSYGQKLGIIKPGDQNYGHTIDLQYRLLGSTEKDPKLALEMLGTKEAHRALEDASISEKYVLERGAYFTQALQEAHEGTPLGLQYLEQAKKQQGPIFEFGQYAVRRDAVDPTTERIAAIQRLERAAIDFEDGGMSWQHTGYKGIHQMPQQTPSGEEVFIARPRQARTGYGSMEEVISSLKAEGSYSSVDIDKEWADMSAAIKARPNDPRLAMTEHVSAARATADQFFQTNAKALLEMSPENTLRKVNSVFGERGAKVAADDLVKIAPKFTKMMGIAAVGLAGVGALWSTSTHSSSSDRRGNSLLTMNYDEWSMSNPPGLAKQGISHQERSSNTDFGSPYQGPATSQSVLMDQELLQAREKWMRQQYRISSFDSEVGLFGEFGVMKYLRRSSYTSNPYGRDIRDGEMPGLKNRRGMKVIDANPTDWKISVEDADTVTLQRRGVRSAVARFFGLNSQDYTFRLEGIDSTETAHGSDSYHAPQPFAEQAKIALENMYKGKRLQIAYDPSNMTYGRNVGVVYSEGKNLNLEEVKRGIASHLPYGKRADAHANWDAFSYAQEKAVASQRGMWATPWAQVYNSFTESAGTQITFDTFAKPSKMAGNYTTMELLTAMEHSQALGSASESSLALAASLGKKWDMRGDNVRPSITFSRSQAHHSGYMTHLLADTNRFMTTQGTNENPYRTSHTRGVGDLNGYLALDTTGSNTSPWARRTLNAYDRYGTKEDSSQRKAKMAMMQRQVNQQFGVSPIGHHRM